MPRRPGGHGSRSRPRDLRLFGPGLDTAAILIFMGVGALLLFVGVAMVAAKLVPAFASFLGWPSARFGGAAGRLARGNARRNPQRTASTAAALMIGIALVTLVAVLGQGMRSTTADDRQDHGLEYAITAQNGFSPVSTTPRRRAASPDASCHECPRRPSEADGRADYVTGIHRAHAQAYHFDWKEGLRRRCYASSERTARSSTTTSRTRTTWPRRADQDHRSEREVDRSRGQGHLTRRRPASPCGQVLDPADALRPNTIGRGISSSFVKSPAATDATTALEDCLKEFPNAKVQTRDQFMDDQRRDF